MWRKRKNGEPNETQETFASGECDAMPSRPACISHAIEVCGAGPALNRFTAEFRVWKRYFASPAHTDNGRPRRLRRTVPEACSGNQFATSQNPQVYAMIQGPSARLPLISVHESMKTTRVAPTPAGDALVTGPAQTPMRDQEPLSGSRRRQPGGELDGLAGVRAIKPRPTGNLGNAPRRLITLAGHFPAGDTAAGHRSPDADHAGHTRGNGLDARRTANVEQDSAQRPRLGLRPLADVSSHSGETRAAIQVAPQAVPGTDGTGTAPGLPRRRTSNIRPAGPNEADNRSNDSIIAQYKAGRRAPDEVLKVTASLLKMSGNFSTTMKLFRAVQQAGIQPSVITYNAAISACDKAGRSDEALGLFTELSDLARRDPSIKPDVVTYNATISMLGKAGRPDDALRLLNELKHLAVDDPSMRPTLISYTAAISACGRSGRATEALSLLAELKQQATGDRSMRPNNITYNAAIAACAKAGRADSALDLLEEMKALAFRDRSMRPNAISYNSTISACGNAGRPREALRLLGELKRLSATDASMRPDTITYNATLTACGKGGLPREALALLDELKHLGGQDASMRPNVVTYNAAISTCESAGWIDRALELLQEIKRLPMGPDVVTYTAAISACGKGGRPDEAIRLFAELKDLARHDSSMRPTVIAYGAAISAHGEAGRARESLALLDEIETLARHDPAMRPTVATYGAVISALETNACADEALDVFNRLKGVGGKDPAMRPTVAIYSATISACGRAGRVDDALRLLSEMKDAARQDASIAPDLGAYNAAIIACSRAGRLDDAQALFEEVGHLGRSDASRRADLVTYSAVISAYGDANRAAPARALIEQAIEERIFQPYAGYNPSTNTMDFHANRICVNPPSSDRPKGVAAGLAVSLLRYHRDAGNLNNRTKYVVGHQGNNAVKIAVLEELNRAQPGAYCIAPNNPGLVVAA